MPLITKLFVCSFALPVLGSTYAKIALTVWPTVTNAADFPGGLAMLSPTSIAEGSFGLIVELSTNCNEGLIK